MSDIPLGRLALEKGWLTPAQLLEALAEQSDSASSTGDPREIGEVLVKKGVLTQEQFDELLREQEATKAPPVREEPRKPEKPRVFGRYLLIKELSRGSSGIVYQAVDGKRGRKVAVKVFFRPGRREEYSRDLARFEREAALAKSLPRHPHIVRLLKAGVIEEDRFIAMEFIDGRTMAEWLKLKEVGLRERVAALRDIARAVQHSHDHGIIHRDLKPDNVLVDESGKARLADFGLAKPLNPMESTVVTLSGMLLGTPAYMSPEQAKGSREVNARTDVYSLGVMLHEILTGRVPFGQKATMMVLLQLVDGKMPTPSEVARQHGEPAPDPVLEEVCLKALRKEPAERTATAGELADALTQWLEGKTADPS